VIVITLFTGAKARRDGRSAPRRRRKRRLHRNGGAGQVGCGSSPESMEGTRARRAVPSPATERRAWGGAVGPRGRSRARPSCSRAFGTNQTATQGRSLELDAMGAMDDAIEDRVGQGGIGDHLVPAADRQRCEALHHRAGLITITGMGDHVRSESVITFHRIE
jgi:hypothetical protein